MIIDEYILKVEQAINSRSVQKQEKLLEEIFSVFKKDIPDIRTGTTYEASIFEIGFKVSGLEDTSLVECNYREDLKLVLAKLKKHREDLASQKHTQTVVNNTSVNITGSVIENSNVASTNSVSENNNPKEKKMSKTKIIVTIISVLAGLAGIITAIIAIIDHLPKQ